MFSKLAEVIMYPGPLVEAFIERLWRSVKYEKVYLNPPQDGIHLNKMINEYFHYYNSERSHSSIADNHPEEIYFSTRQIPDHAKAA
jgi:putative transposase